MRGPPYWAGTAPPVTTLTLCSAPKATRFSLTPRLYSTAADNAVIRSPRGLLLLRRPCHGNYRRAERGKGKTRSMLLQRHLARRAREQLFQFGLAFDERQTGQIFTIQEQKIEQEEDERSVAV